MKRPRFTLIVFMCTFAWSTHWIGSAGQSKAADNVVSAPLFTCGLPPIRFVYTGSGLPEAAPSSDALKTEPSEQSAGTSTLRMCPVLAARASESRETTPTDHSQGAVAQQRDALIALYEGWPCGLDPSKAEAEMAASPCGISSQPEAPEAVKPVAAKSKCVETNNAPLGDYAGHYGYDCCADYRCDDDYCHRSEAPVKKTPVASDCENPWLAEECYPLSEQVYADDVVREDLVEAAQVVVVAEPTVPGEEVFFETADEVAADISEEVFEVASPSVPTRTWVIVAAQLMYEAGLAMQNLSHELHTAASAMPGNMDVEVAQPAQGVLPVSQRPIYNEHHGL